ncbi:MAG: TIGR03936 family radical SAM-associated protein [Candidatus Saccharibacteria bacterium]
MGFKLRVRVEYEKGSDIRFLSHLDMVRLWERLIRRSGVQVKLSQGFNPHLKLSLGTVLPVGVWGRHEYLDFEMDQDASSAELHDKLASQAPPGLTISRVARINDNEPSLMSMVNTARYRISLHNGADVDRIINDIKKSQEVLVERKNKNKTIDIKPGILDLRFNYSDGQCEIDTSLASDSQGGVRLADFIEALVERGLPREVIKDAWREGNFIRQGEVWRSPL